MSRLLKYIAYTALFIFLYVVFLYWVFPYDALKDQLQNTIEQQLGGDLTVSVKKFKPYWITGVSLEGLSIEGSGPQGTSPELLRINSMHARASLFSLIFGKPRINFAMTIGKGEIGGRVKVNEDMLNVYVEMDDFDLASLPFLQAATGLKISSKIKGEATLDIDRQQPVRSAGKAFVNFDLIRIAGTEIKTAGMTITIPDIDIAKGRESQLKITIEKGAINVDEFKFANGEIALDLKGRIFLSNKIENYRPNLTGSFAVPQKLMEPLFFLSLLDSQRQEDGSYPLNISGRLAKPSIKIGTFTWSP